MPSALDAGTRSQESIQVLDATPCCYSMPGVNDSHCWATIPGSALNAGLYSMMVLYDGWYSSPRGNPSQSWAGLLGMETHTRR